MVKTHSGKSTEPIEALCGIEDPVLFQAVLTRLAAMLNEEEWDEIADKLVSLSPRSFVVALAAGQYLTYILNPKRLQWILRGPNPYILNRPTMMLEVRELNICLYQGIQLQILPILHHFTSLRKLHWSSEYLPLPDDAFSLLRQHVPGLQELHVVTERLTAPMLNDIAHMTNLESLELSNTFDSVIPPLGNLRGLKDLKIWDCVVRFGNDGLIRPSTIDGLTRLETLVLSTRMNDDIGQAIPTMLPMLRHLVVSRWGLSENVVASLKSHYENKEGFQLEFKQFL